MDSNNGIFDIKKGSKKIAFVNLFCSKETCRCANEPLAFHFDVALGPVCSLWEFGISKF